MVYFESLSAHHDSFESCGQEESGGNLYFPILSQVLSLRLNTTAVEHLHTFFKRVLIVFLFCVGDVVCILNKGMKHISHISGSHCLVSLKAVCFHGD